MTYFSRSVRKIIKPPLQRLALKYKALSHPTRLEILQYVAKKESCIHHELAQEFSYFAISTLSQHLKILKEADLLFGSPRGKNMVYAINHYEFSNFQKKSNNYISEVLDEVLSRL